MPPTALLVRAAESLDQLNREVTKAGAPANGGATSRTGALATGDGAGAVSPHAAPESHNPRRFYGSVEIDMVRPIKSFDSIFNAVVMELQRTKDAKVKLTLEIEAETPSRFAQSEVSVVRDNAGQLKFKAESTGFE